jgi:hypothetical protein
MTPAAGAEMLMLMEEDLPLVAACELWTTTRH